MSSGPSLARLLALTVRRPAADAVEIRWKDELGGFGLSICRGDSPETIQTGSPLARVTHGDSVILTGLPEEGPHFFKLVSDDGRDVIVGERRPIIEGAPNFRDLGGYETADGRQVKWGKIFRSSNLGRLTDKGLGQIKRIGIRTVCDFRTPAEIDRLPDRFPDSPTVDYLRLPVQHADFEPTSVFDRIKKGDYDWISEDFMLQGYIDSLERYPPVWGRLFEILDDPRHRPLLFHCTGGKDRTGVAAALILLALGVSRETAIADYGLSDGYNADVRRALYNHLRSLGVDLARVEPYFTAPESRIQALLTYVAARHGSAVEYLVKKAGVSEERIARLQADLLE